MLGTGAQTYPHACPKCVGIDPDVYGSELHDLEELLYEDELAEERARLLGVLKARPIPPFATILFPRITPLADMIRKTFIFDSLSQLPEDSHAEAWRKV